MTIIDTNRDPIMYAPMLIPTLCRYKHFKDCVESLAKNTGADKTDLYIALDYPLKQEHWDGYKRICDYIDSITGFKSIHIWKREENYGTAKNIDTARENIFKKYDQLILSEDDNVFSPNFLEFINNGLDKFKDDKSVYAICGYSEFNNLPTDGNNYYRHNVCFSAWGYGIWKNRIVERDTIFKRKDRLKKLLNPISFIKASKRSAHCMLFLFISSMKEIRYTDSLTNLYLFFLKKDVIAPTLTKVRNMGFDGSGIHCNIDDRFEKMEIDSTKQFVYTGNPNNFRNEVNSILLSSYRKHTTYLQAIKFIISYASVLIKKHIVND